MCVLFEDYNSKPPTKTTPDYYSRPLKISQDHSISPKITLDHSSTLKITNQYQPRSPKTYQDHTQDQPIPHKATYQNQPISPTQEHFQDYQLRPQKITQDYL